MHEVVVAGVCAAEETTTKGASAPDCRGAESLESRQKGREATNE